MSMHRYIAGDIHMQGTLHAHILSVDCITNDGTLIALAVYLPLRVVDDPSLLGSQ